jgi:hypothetical protein
MIEFYNSFLIYGYAWIFWLTLVIALGLITSAYSGKAISGVITVLAVYVAILHFFSNIPILKWDYLLFFLIYLGVGIIYSITRFYFVGRAHRNSNMNYSNSDLMLIVKRELSENLVFYAFTYPLHAFEYLLGDFLSLIGDFISDSFSEFSERLFNLGMTGSFTKIKKKEKTRIKNNN